MGTRAMLRFGCDWDDYNQFMDLPDREGQECKWEEYTRTPPLPPSPYRNDSHTAPDLEDQEGNTSHPSQYYNASQSYVAHSRSRGTRKGIHLRAQTAALPEGGRKCEDPPGCIGEGLGKCYTNSAAC